MVLRPTITIMPAFRSTKSQIARESQSEIALTVVNVELCYRTSRKTEARCHSLVLLKISWHQSCHPTRGLQDSIISNRELPYVIACAYASDSLIMMTGSLTFPSFQISRKPTLKSYIESKSRCSITKSPMLRKMAILNLRPISSPRRMVTSTRSVVSAVTPRTCTLKSREARKRG
jgi:hypothetical protein